MATLSFKDFKRDTRLSPSEILLLDEIVGLSKKRGYCWASNESLGEKFNRKVQTVKEYLQKLKKCGYISVAVIRDYKSKEVLRREIYINGEETKFDHHTVTIYKDGEKIVRIVPLKGNGNKTKKESKKEETPEVTNQQPEENNKPEPTSNDEINTVSLTVEAAFRSKFANKSIKGLSQLEKEFGSDRILCVLERCHKPETVGNPIAYIKGGIAQNEDSVFPEWLENKRIAEIEEARREEAMNIFESTIDAYNAYQNELQSIMNGNFEVAVEEVQLNDAVKSSEETVEDQIVEDKNVIVVSVSDVNGKRVLVNGNIYEINDVDSDYLYVIKNGHEDFIEIGSEEADVIKSFLKNIYNVVL